MTEQQRRRLTVGRNPGVAGSGSGSGKGQNLAQLIGDDEKLRDILCLHSVTDNELKKKRSFADKDKAGTMQKADGGEVAYEEPPGDNKDKKSEVQKKLENMKIFYSCKKGMKPESPNQDSFVICVKDGEWGLYGVYDGHGPNGHDVSDFAVRTLVMEFFQQDFVATPGEAFKHSFTKCQVDIEEEKKKSGMDASSSGSTCTMAFHDMKKDELTIAHVGDSRGVLYTGKQCIQAKSKDSAKPAYKAHEPGAKDAGNDDMLVIHATEDHKPNLPEEKKRIEAKGGRVVFDGYYNYRVFAAKGMYPGLNMSRALGDTTAHKEAGLTAEPELKVISLPDLRKKSDVTLVIASDGVWEFIETVDAPATLSEKEGAGKLSVNQVTVDALAKKSWDSWMADSDNEISDDITIVAVIL